MLCLRTVLRRGSLGSEAVNWRPLHPRTLLSFKHFHCPLFLSLQVTTEGPSLPCFLESSSFPSPPPVSSDSDHFSSPSTPLPGPCHSASPERECGRKPETGLQSGEGTAVRAGANCHLHGPVKQGCWRCPPKAAWGLARKSVGKAPDSHVLRRSFCPLSPASCQSLPLRWLQSQPRPGCAERRPPPPHHHPPVAI